MIKNISTALAAFAVVTFAGLSGQAFAQHCSSCASAGNNFGFPASTSSCGRGGCLGGHGHARGQGQVSAHFQELKNQLDHQASVNSKIAARNDAWPMPFACHDKTDYYDTWRPMLAAGNEIQGVLDHNFFTKDNQLNKVGIDRVAGIALNSPVNERAVYVSRSANQAVDQARVSAIRNTISTYYSHRGVVDVRLSEKIPATIAAATSQKVSESYEDNRAPATISDANSVQTAVTQ